ncbi:MAG: hypothetical protein LW841_02190 [Flammeovirgaceae bacterium]|nr:hypothetical protein [Flammeovirgaceae bacterium]
MNTTVKDQPNIEERSTHRTATIKFLANAPSKSAAVAAIAQTNPHATPTHLLSPPASFQ